MQIFFLISLLNFSLRYAWKKGMFLYDFFYWTNNFGLYCMSSYPWPLTFDLLTLNFELCVLIHLTLNFELWVTILDLRHMNSDLWSFIFDLWPIISLLTSDLLTFSSSLWGQTSYIISILLSSSPLTLFCKSETVFTVGSIS